MLSCKQVIERVRGVKKDITPINKHKCMHAQTIRRIHAGSGHNVKTNDLAN